MNTPLVGEIAILAHDIDGLSQYTIGVVTSRNVRDCTITVDFGDVALTLFETYVRALDLSESMHAALMDRIGQSLANVIIAQRNRIIDLENANQEIRDKWAALRGDYAIEVFGHAAAREQVTGLIRIIMDEAREVHLIPHKLAEPDHTRNESDLAEHLRRVRMQDGLIS
jgi:hypothetical protein